VAKLLDSPRIQIGIVGAAMALAVKNTFIYGVENDSNSTVSEECDGPDLCLRRTRTQPTPIRTTKSVEDHVAQHEDDMTHPLTDGHPCERELHFASDDTPPPSAAAAQQEDDVSLPALCRFEAREDEPTVLASVALQQPIAFTEKNTFIDDIADNSNSAMLPLKRAHTAPAPTITTESEDTDGTVGHHVTVLEEDASPVLNLCRVQTEECWPELQHHSTPMDAALASAATLDSTEVEAEHWHDWHYHSIVIPVKKISGAWREHTSELFDLCEGGKFKFVLRPCAEKGGFQASKGVGKVDLKWFGESASAGRVHFRIAAGLHKELPFQDSDHDFATRPLSTTQHEWNFPVAYNKGSLVLHIEARRKRGA